MAGVKGQHRTQFATTANRARQRAWQTLRMNRFFDMAFVQATAEIGKDNLWAYLQRLIKAGYVVLAKERENGKPGSFNSYRLVRDTGPQAPIPWRDGGVFDPNSGAIYGPDGNETEA